MGRREELLRAEAEGWERLTGVLEALAPEVLERPGVNTEGWSLRDMMWHVAYWCADAARALGEIADGTFDRSAEPEGGAVVDAINDREVERSRRMSLAAVQQELHRARAAMLERFGALDVITAEAVEWFEESGPIHYAEHLPQVEAWVASLER